MFSFISSKIAWPFGLTNSACQLCLYIPSLPSMSGSTVSSPWWVLWASSIAGRWDGGAHLWQSACGRCTRRNCYAHSCCIPRCGIHSSSATARTMWLGLPYSQRCIYTLPCAVAALLLPACGWLFLRAVPSGLLPGLRHWLYLSACSALVCAFPATRLLPRLVLWTPSYLLYIAWTVLMKYELPMYTILALSIAGMQFFAVRIIPRQTLLPLYWS